MATKKTTSALSKSEVKEPLAKQVEAVSEKTSEELVVENFAATSQALASMTETVDLLIGKVESMACHIIATEEILRELVADNGLNLVRVNARIRAKLAIDTDVINDSSKAIDVAASIASPLPRR